MLVAHEQNLLLTVERHHQTRQHNVMRWCHETSLAKLLYTPPIRVLCPLFSGSIGLGMSSCLLFTLQNPFFGYKKLSRLNNKKGKRSILLSAFWHYFDVL